MTKNIRKKRSPGKRILFHKVKRKVQKSHCMICGAVLTNNPKTDVKSGKHADRPFGGEICHACLRTSIQVLPI